MNRSQISGKRIPNTDHRPRILCFIIKNFPSFLSDSVQICETPSSGVNRVHLHSQKACCFNQSLRPLYRNFQLPCCVCSVIESLSTRVFETRTATGRGHLVCQDSGVSQIFIPIISNRENTLSNGNVVAGTRVKRENNSLPVAVRVSKTCVLKVANRS